MERKLELTHALADAGVSLRLGTDAPQPFAVPGSALHQELAAFERSGVARPKAWKLASADAARALGVVGSGSIEPGMRADVLVSSSSPLEEGWQPAKISAVLAGGHLMLAKDLDAAIARELARFENGVGHLLSRWLAKFAVGRLARRFVP